MTPDWSASPVLIPYANLGSPQTFNLYAYVSNNPLNGIDPDGHFLFINGCNPASGTVCGKDQAEDEVSQQQQAQQQNDQQNLQQPQVQSTSYTTTTTDFSPYGQSFHGQGAASVTVTQTTWTTTTTTNADGTTTTTRSVATTQTTAYYSLTDGGYLGATQSRGNGLFMNTPTEISHREALQTIGPAAMGHVADIAAPGRAGGFMIATKQDMRRNPEKYVVAALSIANAIIDPPSGVRSGIRAILPLVVAIEEAVRNSGK
jgi:hypothetical protein